MKKIIILIGVGLLIVGAIIFQSYSVSSNTTVDYKLNNRTYKLLKAGTPKEWEKGLMNVRKPTEIEGMIFLFPDKQIRNFWNKNTFVDLDVYWLNDKNIVGKELLPSIEKSKNLVIISSLKPVNRVIEVIK
jgi:uncharacterized membrane protein (UPF0127 family)